MPRIAIIGAGSQVFAQAMIRDVLSFPALRGSTFALMDIDPEPLGYMETIARKIVAQGGYPARIEATADREDALRGADYIIVSILVGDRHAIALEVDIPLKYGVDQCIADTMGPGGIFRAMRTVPVMVDIARDTQSLCPQALMINYTNPMSMLCNAVTRQTGIRMVGLCHSVQGAHWELAQVIGEAPEDCTSWVAGINHQAWVLSYACRGEDAYPAIRKAAWENREWWENNTVRVEMLRHLNYYVTESSGHNSEYNPWFRKRPELIEKYMGDGFGGESGYIKKLYMTEREAYMGHLRAVAEQSEPYDLAKGHEYGASIINAMETGETFRFNGTVRNTDLIANLPAGCMVEVPCYVDKGGIHPCYVGELPPQLAALNSMCIRSMQMGVEAALRRDRDLLFWAIAYDPLTSAVLSLEEIRAMVDEMCEAERDVMPPLDG